MKVRPCALLAVSLLAACAPASTTGSARPARGVSTANAFIDAIGVDSHFDYADAPYVLIWPRLRDVLIASGIRHIRDGDAPEAGYAARLAELGAHGITHGVGFSIDATPDVVRQRIAAFAPYADNVEPQNEYDSQQDDDPDWAAHLVTLQKMIYRTVRADPANAHITVLGPPLEHQRLYADVGPLDDFEDAGNLHDATCDMNPGTLDPHRGAIGYMQGLVRASTLRKPIWTTETGYNDDMQRHCAIGDDAIAKYDPRVIAERWNANEDRIYFYQFADMPKDPIFGGMGLVRADGTPKPQLTALSSMIHFLTDTAAPFRPTPLAYRLGGNTNDVHTTLLEKHDGRYELLVWLEVVSWNPWFRFPIKVAPQDVTIALPDSIRHANRYSYTSEWALRGEPLIVDAHSVHVQVTDAISFVELSH